ncbi:MAG: D-glycero-alpha-D-manno-heptose-1,7-bisphosphate 7-phosphatase, partial [Planctomycetota bacterium]
MTNAAVFFDRDGTLVEDPGYLNHPDQVALLDGAAEVLKELKLLGYKTVVVTNQSGVARGIVSEEMLGRIHERLGELLAQKGAALDGVYYCPYHPEGVIPKYCRDSDWRKPEPGMLLAAAKEMDIDLSKSWIVGDSQPDMEAGRSAGCRTILLRSASAGHEESGSEEVDYVAVNIREAANMIKKSHRSGREESAREDSTTQTESVSGPEYSVTALEAEELSSAPTEAEATATPDEPSLVEQDTPQLLAQILEQLKRTEKTEMFGEFSIMRLLAGIVQVFVLFCLLMALWFLMRPNQQVNVLMALGFGTVLQAMALTFYI